MPQLAPVSSDSQTPSTTAGAANGSGQQILGRSAAGSSRSLCRQRQLQPRSAADGHPQADGEGVGAEGLVARSDRAERGILPVLDMMQTIPSFVYLIPILMLLGIGKVPGLIAVCVYAIPPIIRLTNLGIREVDKETLEASEAFGATTVQKLRSVQIPLALPTVFAGVNQTIMMALAMVVIASMIGVKGLGVPILRAVSNQYLALGLFNGLAIVALAIVFDRVTQEYGRRIQKHRGIKK